MPEGKDRRFTLAFVFDPPAGRECGGQARSPDTGKTGFQKVATTEGLLVGHDDSRYTLRKTDKQRLILKRSCYREAICRR